MIENLTIKNYKCFLSTSIKLNRITILAGTNAVGKSSLIQVLLLIRQTIDKFNLTTKYRDKTDYNNAINDFQNFCIRLNDVYNLNLGDSSQILSSDAISNEITFIINDHNSSKKQIDYFVSRDNPELVLRLKNLKGFNKLDNDLSICKTQFHYLTAERLGPRVLQQMINQDFDNVGCQGEYTGYVLAKNGKLKVDEKRRISDSKLKVPDLNKQVEFWLNYIIPGVEISTELYQEINKVGFYLRRTYSDTKPLNPNNMGFGISYVLPIIVSGLIAENGSLLIVENPEAHLHPSGQSKIGQFLSKVASSGVQVIVETHSEHVINGIRIATLKNIISNELISINFFSMGEKSIEPNIEHITLDNKADLSNWPYGFFDQEEIDLAEIFEGRKNEI